MKKFTSFVVSLFLVFGVGFGVTSAAIVNGEVRTEIRENVTGTMEALVEDEVGKEKVMQAIDQAIYNLNYIKKNINDSYLKDNTKFQANIAIDNTIIALSKMKTDLEAAQSPEDIKVIIQDVKQYAQDNKDDLAELAKVIQKEAVEDTIEYLEYSIDELEQMLHWLKLVCPAQKSDIDTLIANIGQLDVLLAQIEISIETGNYADVADMVMECEGIILETTEAIVSILENC